MLGLAVMVSAARRHRRPARRSVDGDAHETEQSDLLQALFGRNGDSPIPVVAPATPAELLRLRDRGLADRAPLHDPGRLSLRRIPRHRLRAVADPGARLVPDLRVPNRTERAGFYPYERDPETLAASMGQVPGTPAWKRGSALEKLRTAWAPLATTLKTTTGCSSCSAGEDRPESLATSRRRGLRAAEGRAPHPGMGQHVWRIRSAWSGSRARAGRSPTRTCANMNHISHQHRRRSRTRSNPHPHPRAHWVSCACLIRSIVPGGRGGLQPRPRQAVHDPRDPGEGRAGARRPVRPTR